MRTAALLLMAVVMILAACGGGSEEPARVPEGDGGQEIPDSTVTEPDQVTEPDVPAPLYPEGTLDPSAVTAETPVSASALYHAYYIWDGRTVVLQGYPDVMYGDSMIVEDELSLVEAPGGDEELATFTFPEVQNVPVREDQLVTVRGTVDYYWTGDLYLIDAEFVEGAEEIASGVETSPYVYDGASPLPVADFYQLFNVWSGRELLVEGYYHSTTTSTTDYGVTIRVDLAEPDDIYTKYVACEMAGEIPAQSESLMVENRDGVRIRGTVAGESFSMVGLEDCVLVNR